MILSFAIYYTVKKFVKEITGAEYTKFTITFDINKDKVISFIVENGTDKKDITEVYNKHYEIDNERMEYFKKNFLKKTDFSLKDYTTLIITAKKIYVLTKDDKNGVKYIEL